MKYRKKPVVIEAFQLGVDNIPDWFMQKIKSNDIVLVCNQTGSVQCCNIKTLEGLMTADLRDFIIKGVKGELYPCKPDIFEATYEPAE